MSLFEKKRYRILHLCNRFFKHKQRNGFCALEIHEACSFAELGMPYFIYSFNYLFIYLFIYFWNG